MKGCFQSSANVPPGYGKKSVYDVYEISVSQRKETERSGHGGFCLLAGEVRPESAERRKKAENPVKTR